MNKSITQATQNDKQISKSIKRFFTRFHVSSALKASNAYKKKGVPVMEIFQYLFLLIFSNRSMYMNLITGRNTPDFAKDTVYRFMKMIQINWIRFTTILSARIIRDAIFPLDSEERANVFIIDDSMFERNRSKKVELLAKAYDHAKHKYLFGFRMLTLGWSDGSSFLPVNSILLSTENRKNRINEATEVDKRTVGYKRRKLSLEKGTQAMLTLLDAARKATISAKYVLFDSWFSSPRTLHAVKSMGYDVIGMVKKTPKMFFRYNGEDMSLTSIYNKNKKRRGRSRYLLSVMIDVVTDGEIIPAKVVYVRNSLSYDAMTAHTAVVFTRYMILSLGQCQMTYEKTEQKKKAQMNLENCRSFRLWQPTATLDGTKKNCCRLITDGEELKNSQSFSVDYSSVAVLFRAIKGTPLCGGWDNYLWL